MRQVYTQTKVYVIILRALRADARLQRIGRQRLVAVFAAGSEFEHGFSWWSDQGLTAGAGGSRRPGDSFAMAAWRNIVRTPELPS
jgi:hypothetical protein